MDCDLHRYLNFPSYYVLIFTILPLPKPHHKKKKKPATFFTTCLHYFYKQCKSLLGMLCWQTVYELIVLLQSLEHMP